jgi:hypothetical protein
MAFSRPSSAAENPRERQNGVRYGSETPMAAKYQK